MLFDDDERIIMNDDNNYGIVQKKKPTIKWGDSVNIEEQTWVTKNTS